MVPMPQIIGKKPKKLQNNRKHFPYKTKVRIHKDDKTLFDLTIYKNDQVVRTVTFKVITIPSKE